MLNFIFLTFYCHNFAYRYLNSTLINHMSNVVSFKTHSMDWFDSLMMKLIRHKQQ